jgi:hypothetical protein
MNRFFLLCGALVTAAAFGAEIKGRVRYAGTESPAALPVTRDLKVCGSNQPDESLLVSKDRGLKNVVAFLKEAPAAVAPSSPKEHVLDQVGCRYAPHVIAAQVGDRLLAVNSDSLLHNVRGTATDGKTPFNVAMPLAGMKRAFELKEPGLIRTGCDAGHTWMTAYVQVFAHRFFAVTGDDGRFVLPNVPPGKYTLVVWHERLGQSAQSLTVTSRGAQAQFDLK